MINVKKWVKNAILSRAGGRKSPKKCNAEWRDYDKRFANGRFVLMRHNKIGQQKSNWYTEEPKINYIIKDDKLKSIIIQYQDWQFQWEN